MQVQRTRNPTWKINLYYFYLTEIHTAKFISRSLILNRIKKITQQKVFYSTSHGVELHSQVVRMACERNFKKKKTTTTTTAIEIDQVLSMSTIQLNWMVQQCNYLVRSEACILSTEKESTRITCWLTVTKAKCISMVVS